MEVIQCGPSKLTRCHTVIELGGIPNSVREQRYAAARKLFRAVNSASACRQSSKTVAVTPPTLFVGMESNSLLDSVEAGVQPVYNS
jgi:hypothetical protein